MCLNEEELKHMLRELHEGICGSHTIKTSLALKALRNDYFWSIMKANALDLVKTCEKCQRHAYVPRKPPTKQLPLKVVWSFNQLMINLLGPFLIASGQLKYWVVTIEYFMKLIEAEPLTTINV